MKLGHTKVKDIQKLGNLVTWCFNFKHISAIPKWYTFIVQTELTQYKIFAKTALTQ